MFLCKQKTAYEMRISDLSSDVCSSDRFGDQRLPFGYRVGIAVAGDHLGARREHGARIATGAEGRIDMALARRNGERGDDLFAKHGIVAGVAGKLAHLRPRSEEHTSELQSLMRISYAVFCLKKKKIINNQYA